MDHQDARLVALRAAERDLHGRITALQQAVPNARDFPDWDAFYVAYGEHQDKLLGLERERQDIHRQFREVTAELRSADKTS